MTHGNLNSLKDLKILRKKITDENKEDQRKLLYEFHQLIENWEDELPNLGDTLQSEEIDWLLSDSIDYFVGKEIIRFVARTGYKDEPDVDKDGKPVLHRTTPIHRAINRIRLHVIPDLFKIYDRFDVNYTDEFGWSHFHAACMSDCDDVVRKFLEFGQNPNCFATNADDSPLQLALRYGGEQVARLLLRKGAHLHAADRNRSTPLHLICQEKYDDDFVEFFFKINDEQHQPVEVNARDLWRRTPLHYAAQRRFKKAIELLIRNGADPNLVDEEREIPLHKICNSRSDKESAVLLKFYFDVNDEVRQAVEVDAWNKRGHTPLHLALLFGLHKTAEVLLRRGADPNEGDAQPLHSICLRCHDDGEGAAFLKIFFEICAEKHHEVYIDAQDERGQTPLRMALGDYGNVEAAALLLRNGADPTLTDANARTPLHLICNGSNDDEGATTLLKVLLDVSDEFKRAVNVDALDKWDIPPLYLAVQRRLYKTAELLLRRGADPELVFKNRLLLLHLICREGDHDQSARFLQTFIEICAEKHHEVQIDARDESGQTPLHKALYLGNNKVVELLLRNGANPNLTDASGQTPLHMLCRYGKDEESVIIISQIFFDVSDEVHRSVEVDTPDKSGETPLHSSLKCNNKKMTEFLLRRGADPNLINERGRSPLHSIIECTQESLDDDFVERFFMICDEVNRVLQVDVRDQSGQTPLRLALSLGCRQKTAKLLLRRGANPNLADEEGMTYLHNCCQSRTMFSEVALLKTFFEINDNTRKTIQIDARDKKGRTPMQLAVSNLMAHAVEILLDRGADLSSFIFPSECDFDESLQFTNERWKLEAAYGALAIVENLEKRGYELNRSDALAIMKTFAKFKLFEKSEELEFWDHDDEYARHAKEIMINPNLSFNDLIQLRPEEAAKLLTPTDYCKFLRTVYCYLPNETVKALMSFNSHLCEKMAGGCFRGWALEPFLELTHQRLPILCCEMIIQNLNNEDLYNICLAAEIAAKEERHNT